MSATESCPGPVGFTVRQGVACPISEVFDAVVDPEKLCRYFTATASGPLATGATVRWSWASGEEDDTICVEVVPDEKIVLTWTAYRVDYRTLCTFEFEAHEESWTGIRVTETGWLDDEAGIRSSHEHSSGWTHMLACLKAWLEHGIDLR